MHRSPLLPCLLISLALVLAPRESAHAATAADTLVFAPRTLTADSTGAEPPAPLTVTVHENREGEWLRAPLGDALLMHPDPWLSLHPKAWHHADLDIDYNRVDLLRYGARIELQKPDRMTPRLGARFDYATGRKRTLYGVQLEQPLLPTARFVAGVSAVRLTDHSELQQIDDVENSLALLLAREDWRDYFEREGLGAYLSWRVPEFSTVSLHLRRDRYRSLVASQDVRSLLRKDRSLRDNPAVDDGESHSLLLRLERLTRRTQRGRGGLYHWIEFERSGGALGGDFSYSRALADVRSVLRLGPSSTLALRGVGGAVLAGELPRQKQFTVGGIDGLRAHPFGAYRGDHMALGQAEYSVALSPLRAPGVEGALHALAFADAGTAWNSTSDGYDVVEQRFAVDGGIGLSTPGDDVRIYVAKRLQKPDDGVVVSVRLQRPF